MVARGVGCASADAVVVVALLLFAVLLLLFSTAPNSDVPVVAAFVPALPFWALNKDEPPAGAAADVSLPAVLLASAVVAELPKSNVPPVAVADDAAVVGLAADGAGVCPNENPEGAAAVAVDDVCAAAFAVVVVGGAPKLNPPAVGGGVAPVGGEEGAGAPNENDIVLLCGGCWCCQTTSLCFGGCRTGRSDAGQTVLCPLLQKATSPQATHRGLKSSHRQMGTISR